MNAPTGRRSPGTPAVERRGLVCIRAGHHCARPAMDFFGVPATARASFGPCTTTDDIDRLAEGLRLASRLLR